VVTGALLFRGDECSTVFFCYHSMFLMDGWYCFVIVELGSCLLSPLAVIACGCIVVIVFLDAYSTGHQLILNTQSGFDGPRSGTIYD